ncbi:MAG: hypothetical protein JRI23_02255 [Deltaproteobacteria bacterium]|nr:hypothetical protein [Deltaproteobacteria bacterium]
MKISPHLFIGLGGCGSQIVNEIARKFKRKEEEYARYQQLVHLMAFHTDQHELKKAESVDVRVPISDFDKRSFVAHSFGQRGAGEDPLLTSWWPEHYMPRDVAGAGAGQIRIESRLSLYFTLKYKPEVFTALERIVGESFSIDARFRDVDKFPMVHIYASLAGGTGSGSFLPVALLAAELFRPHKRPIVVGSFVLPAVFKRAGLPAQQLDKIMANGYAALMELEHMQAASEEEPVPFQYDPRSKELQSVGRRAFDQIYLVDDIGAKREVITDTRLIYQAIADSAYTQIFSDILGRQSSTADNDEREMGVTDVNKYTKRYGSFGLSLLLIPDADILDYCAHRYAVESLTRTFALPDDAGSAEPQDFADRDRRDQQFVRTIIEQANLPGESGQFFRSIMDKCDGSEAVQGAVDRFLRYFQTEFHPRFDKHLGAMPRWTEDRLLEYDEDPESVRLEMPKRLEAWRKFAAEATERVDQEAELIAGEVSGDAHEHSFAKLAGNEGPIFERLFLIRVAGKLREMQAQARAVESGAEQKLKNLPNGYMQWVERLEEAAPKTITEYLRGNDYGSEAVPEFMGWYRNNMEGPQLEKLRASGVVDLCDDLIKVAEQRKDNLGTLFGELCNIRATLESTCDELLRYGVRRETGGVANEHVLDVEVFENYEDPDPFRMWHWVFESRELPSDYDPSQIFPAIQEAYGKVRHARHMSEAVCDALVAMGHERWRERIEGKRDAETPREMGLELIGSLEEEARLALTWAKLRKHHGSGRDFRLGSHRREWETAAETVGQSAVDDYITSKIQYGAKKCAPFLRLAREEHATSIEPKRYVAVYQPYLDDDRLRQALTGNERFPVKGGDVLATEDPKRVVFYWSELGMPIYRIESMDDYFERYAYVKRDELSRGKTYRWDDLPYQPKGAAQHAKHCEGRKVPDIPLHTDKRWEGAPDEYECLAHIAPKQVFGGHGKMAWLESRQTMQTQRAGEELVSFVFAQCFELIVQREDGRFVFTNDDIPERDRVLGKFRDEAFAAFRQAKLPIREWLTDTIDARQQRFIDERDHGGVKALIGAHKEQLGKLRMQLEGKEQAFVEREFDATDHALESLLAKM